MKPSARLSRRACLQAMGSLALLPTPLRAQALATDRLARKRLIVLMLAGGNDGLNTLVPVRDPLYRRLRPTLALSRHDCLPLNGELALHPALRSLRALHERGEVAVVQDVGYPQPNLSHFVSTDVWHSGNTSPALAREGWWGNLVQDHRSLFDAAGLDAHAMLFTPGNAMARGHGVELFLASQLPRGGATPPSAARLRPLPATAPSLQRQLAEGIEMQQRIAHRFAQRLAGRPLQVPDETADLLMQQVQLLLAALDRGVAVPLFKLEQGGYDMHSGQRERQAEQFAALDAALATLAAGLRAAGQWDDTLVLVHSEFGRRAAQNGHGGTDHGAAGPAFLLGGKVAGGLYGQMPRLDRLDENGNLVAGTDLRRLYATVAGPWFGLPADRFATQGQAALDGVLA